VSVQHDVVDPATAEVIATVPMADLQQTDEAIERAARAFPAWRDTAPADRARLLRPLRRGGGRRRRPWPRWRCATPATPWATPGGRLATSATSCSTTRRTERLFGRQIPVAGGVDLTFHEPLGVVGIIVPGTSRCRSPAGAWLPRSRRNTVVLKPAELTPLTAIRLGELALAAGLPPDVLTVLPGKGSVVGERFVTHPLVRKVCFTGSTAVGKRIMAGCAAQVKRVTLELGGKNANVVFADADLERAAATAPYAVFDNAGQDCCARSRILVQRSVFDRFLELLEPGRAGRRRGRPR
jgi:acyl-CoA reductase-like NAD-dependent aldehyde dehydrogenase